MPVFALFPASKGINGFDVTYPRILVGPGQRLYELEARAYYWCVLHHIDSLRRSFPFDLIHAHFAYPDGVVAARLGRRYQVPVIITEHAMWQPWMDNYPEVRRQAIWAVRHCTFQVAGSRRHKDSIVQETGLPEKVHIIPIGMDSALFNLPETEEDRNPNQIVFVGRLEPVKGVGDLILATAQLVKARPEISLVLVGGSLYGVKNPEEERLRALVQELGLENNVKFAGFQPPAEVAEIMRQSALLVLPSHRESFGSVLIEALACGTPVVATRCGGPEDIVNDQYGCLAPPGDADALAAAINHVLTHSGRYQPAELASYARENYSWEYVAWQTFMLYQEALDQFDIGNNSKK